MLSAIYFMELFAISISLANQKWKIEQQIKRTTCNSQLTLGMKSLLATCTRISTEIRICEDAQNNMVISTCTICCSPGIYDVLNPRLLICSGFKHKVHEKQKMSYLRYSLRFGSPSITSDGMPIVASLLTRGYLGLWMLFVNLSTIVFIMT